MSEIIIPRMENSLNTGDALVAFLKPNEECDLREMKEKIKPGSVLAVDDDRNLPVYPSIDDFVIDVVESDFNPDIDKTLHFTSADLDDIIVWSCKPLGELRDTAHFTVKLAYAVLLLGPINMEPLKVEIKLKAAKYAKNIEKLNPQSGIHMPQELTGKND